MEGDTQIALAPEHREEEERREKAEKPGPGQGGRVQGVKGPRSQQH